jgi:hypothetical protein
MESATTSRSFNPLSQPRSGSESEWDMLISISSVLNDQRPGITQRCGPILHKARILARGNLMRLNHQKDAVQVDLAAKMDVPVELKSS